jgi:hypothetical protein
VGTAITAGVDVVDAGNVIAKGAGDRNPCGEGCAKGVRGWVIPISPRCSSSTPSCSSSSCCCCCCSSASKSSNMTTFDATGGGAGGAVAKYFMANDAARLSC